MNLHNDESTVPLPDLTLNLPNKGAVNSSMIFNGSLWFMHWISSKGYLGLDRVLIKADVVSFFLMRVFHAILHDLQNRICSFQGCPAFALCRHFVLVMEAVSSNALS